MLTEQADRELVRKRWAVARRLTLIWRGSQELTWLARKTRIGHVPTGRTKPALAKRKQRVEQGCVILQGEPNLR